MAKKYRQFKRVSFKAITAELIVKKLVDRTLQDHNKKCWLKDEEMFLSPCPHEDRRTLQVARLIDAHMEIGKKRAHLDIPCPYAGGDADEQIKVLKVLALRLLSFSEGLHYQMRKAWMKGATVISDYANRNAMQVLAETVIDRD